MNNYCKILIADDELIMRQGIAHMVDWEKEGFQIIGQASNGQEAIEIIKADTPHIVITDVVMPKVDGIELAQYIQQNYPSIKIIVLSSYSDFDYVKSSFKNGAVDYILKPSLNLAQLLETLKKSASNFPDLSIPTKTSDDEYMLSQMLIGPNSAIDSNLINKIFIHNSFCLFGLNIKSLKYNHKTEKDLLDSLNYNLKNDAFSEYVIKRITGNDDYILFLINFDLGKYDKLLKLLTATADNCTFNFTDAFFIVSCIFSSVDKLKSTFENNFVELSKESFYNKGARLIVSSEFKTPPSSTKFDFKQFAQLTAKMEINESLDMLTSYVNTILNRKSLSEFELKTLIQNCFYNVISTLESIDDNLSKLHSLKYSCFNKIQESRYSDELLENYTALLSIFTDIVDEYQNRINSHMVNKIIQYINDNYAEPLNLSDVAKLFNFNYYYLSSYFSSHTKEGFNEYLNKIRIEKACEFLKKDIPISDISSMVGYSDHSYFCKVFKKFTGVTPSSFRKKSIKILQ